MKFSDIWMISVLSFLQWFCFWGIIKRLAFLARIRSFMIGSFPLSGARISSLCPHEYTDLWMKSRFLQSANQKPGCPAPSNKGAELGPQQPIVSQHTRGVSDWTFQLFFIHKKERGESSEKNKTLPFIKTCPGMKPRRVFLSNSKNFSLFTSLRVSTPPFMTRSDRREKHSPPRPPNIKMCIRTDVNQPGVMHACGSLSPHTQSHRISSPPWSFVHQGCMEGGLRTDGGPERNIPNNGSVLYLHTWGHTCCFICNKYRS